MGAELWKCPAADHRVLGVRFRHEPQNVAISAILIAAIQSLTQEVLDEGSLQCEKPAVDHQIDEGVQMRRSYKYL